MGLGLPDGGHLTHGYYVRIRTYILVLAFLTSRSDCQKEDDCIFHLLPVLPLRNLS